MSADIPNPDAAPATGIKPPLEILLAAPRGFCAGVVRAIDVVERALAIYGPPVYVRHEIVHNKYVVESLKRKGAVFVRELDEVPDSGAPVIFSAHGVAKTVPANAVERGLTTIDATCPLVTKVHREAEIHHKRGRHVLLVGHSGHPEVVGTMGQLPKGSITLVEDLEQIAALEPENPNNLAWVTQTTLSVDDTRHIVDALKQKFPNITGPHKDDICYATTNRQEAVKQIAPLVAETADRIAGLDQFIPWFEALQSPEGTSASQSGATALISGSLTPEAFMQQVQAAQ